MIVKEGNLLESVTSGFIIHGANSLGVMGSGFAKELKEVYPEAYALYKQKFMHIGLKLGEVVTAQVSDDLVVHNAVTQRAYYGHPTALPGQTRFTDYEAMATAMETANGLAAVYPNIEPVMHFPMIGAYRGGGDWEIIKTIIERTVVDLDLTLWVLK